jgi:urea transport system permease protein
MSGVLARLGRPVAVLLATIGLWLCQPIGAAHADAFGDTVAGLAADGFAAKAEAVEKLGSLGDSRAIPVLKALEAGELAITADKRIVFPKDGDLIDGATGQKLGAAAGKDAERIRLNNRLRGAVASALGRLTLFSEIRAERLAAAAEILKDPSAEGREGLVRAIGAEKDSSVAAAMRLALDAIDVLHGDSPRKLAALERLGGSSDPRVRALVGMAAQRANDPQVKAAADEALRAIERRQQYLGVALNVFQGISLGSVLLLAAIGLAITFGVMGVINMAHGEMIMLGAYSAFVVQEIFRTLPRGLLDYYLVAAIPVAFLVAGAVGVLLERTVIRFLYGRPLETLLATWGISLMLQQVVRMVFGAPNKEVANPTWMTGAVELMPGFAMTLNRLVIIAFCFAVLAAVALVLQRTWFGLQMRAVTQNRDMASAMGIRTDRIDMMTFGLGSGIAGMAGVALSQIGNVSPNLGQIYIVDSFLVVVFGGVGNLIGTLVASMGLGVVNKLLEPYAGAVLGKIAVLVAVILFIQWRPRGLFALRGRAEEA